MRVRKLAAPVGVAAVMISIAAGTAVQASAANNIKPFGQQETLNDYATGGPMIGYTVTGLNPSSDAVPHNGQLYEATVTVAAPGGWATPLVPLFNARAESGQNYRVLTDGGLGGAVPPGGSSTGKLYFDVVGDNPNSVVYNDGVQDLLVWVPGAPEGGVPSGAPASAGSSTEIVGNAPAGGAESEGPAVSAAPSVIAAPEEVNPFETNTPDHSAGRGR